MKALWRGLAVDGVNQDFPIAGDGDGLAVGGEAEAIDDGRLEVDGGLGVESCGGGIVFGTGAEPVAEEGDVGVRKCVFAERHAGLDCCGEIAEGDAVVGLVGKESGTTLAAFEEVGVSGEVEAGGFARGLMAAGAMLLEQGLDFAVVAGSGREAQRDE